MVKDVTSKQTKINKIIDDYGTSIIVTTVSGESYNEDSGWTDVTSGTITTNVVPYDYSAYNMNFKEQGNIVEGQIRLITKGNISLTEKDTFIYNSKTYIISNVEPLPLANKQAGDSLGQVIEAVEQLQ